jgi:DNA-binding NtrC family response regulator
MNETATPRNTERSVLCVSTKADAYSADYLSQAGWQVIHADTTAAAERLLEHRDVMVGLIELPQTYTSQEISALTSCMRRTETTWVALIEPGQMEDETASRLILDYCFDFVTRPCPDERLGFALGHALGLSRLRRAAVIPGSPEGRHAMIGHCDAMQQLYRHIDKCAVTHAPVHIAGESGTGKELTARAIHDRSPRSGRAFIAINCAAVPATLLHAELFGFERGAFTGALQRKTGRIEAAHEGTLFLDEIGDLPLECQAVLLRFLQEGTIERLGGNGPIHVDVRVVSATHVDLEGAVAEGRFRADLYHRLCVLRLVEPPLRERGEDIRLLAEHALRLYRQDGDRKIRGFTTDAVVAMSNYAWPGNVREMINCVRRAVVMAEDRFLSAADLGLPVPSQEAQAETLAVARSRAEKVAVAQALQRNGYNLSEAAVDLGISRATLYRLISANGLETG